MRTKYGRTAHKPTPATSAGSPEQALRESITAAAEALAEELRQGKSERFTALLAFAARFHHYSLGNQLLIAQQCPEATRVAGYKTWEGLGYHVERGQHGIRILAPRTYSRRGEEGEADQALADAGVTERKAVYFASVPVFDVSQLNPEEVAARPLPTFYYASETDQETDALCTRAVAAMAAAGITVEGRDDLASPEHQGYSRGGYVAVRAGLPSRNRFKTLVHEWAHELLHQGAAKADAAGLSKGVRECHAEATSYVVCAHFGLHNPFSSDYLKSWGADATTLLAELGAVHSAAMTIITTLKANGVTDIGAGRPEAA
jgi:hypothetical protein